MPPSILNRKDYYPFPLIIPVSMSAFKILNIFRVALVAVIVMSVLSGCADRYDERLTAVQSVMEERPDSALALLEDIALPADAPEGDRALYGMLLTQARYKNFIDEDNDSLINISAEYFQRQDDPEKAATSLYLAGYIQINIGKRGEAAVSLRKGLDLARKHNLYMTEGRCAKGLHMLYIDLMDGSNQVRYAKESFDAFTKGGFEDWACYAKLDMAIAYNNSLNYAEAIEKEKELISIAQETRDTVLLTVALRLMGTSQCAAGNYNESVRCYTKSFDLNPEVFDDKDNSSFIYAASQLNTDSIPSRTKEILSLIDIKDKAYTPYDSYALQGDYENAYKVIRLYKERCDSILTVLLSNDVSDSISVYERNKKELEREKIKYERIVWAFVILLSVTIGAFTVYSLRKRMLEKERDYWRKLETVKAVSDDLKKQVETNKKLSESAKELFRQKYSYVNSLCSTFYEIPDAKADNDRMMSEMQKIVEVFTDNATLKKEIEYIDKNMDGLYSDFLKDINSSNEKYNKTFLYLAMGFCARSISVFLNVKIEAVYNYKSRLKSKIEASESPRKEEYLSVLK